MLFPFLLLWRYIVSVPAHLCLSRRTQLSCQWQMSHYYLTVRCEQLSAVYVPHFQWPEKAWFQLLWVTEGGKRINYVNLHNQLSRYLKNAFIYVTAVTSYEVTDVWTSIIISKNKTLKVEKINEWHARWLLIWKDFDRLVLNQSQFSSCRYVSP